MLQMRYKALIKRSGRFFIRKLLGDKFSGSKEYPDFPKKRNRNNRESYNGGEAKEVITSPLKRYLHYLRIPGLYLYRLL